MKDDNKRNLVFFESDSMRGLYDVMDAWQSDNQKRLLSLNVQREGNAYCCIALTNPSEVIICGPYPHERVIVSNGCLHVVGS